MTKDQAEARVRECKERVIEAVRRRHAQAQGGQTPAISEGWHDAAIYAAGTDLAAAESALAAFDKPRLMPPELRGHMAWNYGPPSGPGDLDRRFHGAAITISEIRADRADILAQAEKLPRYDAMWGDTKVTLRNGDAILLSDLRKLLEGK